MENILVEGPVKPGDIGWRSKRYQGPDKRRHIYSSAQVAQMYAILRPFLNVRYVDKRRVISWNPKGHRKLTYFEFRVAYFDRVTFE